MIVFNYEMGLGMSIKVMLHCGGPWTTLLRQFGSLEEAEASHSADIAVGHTRNVHV